MTPQHPKRNAAHTGARSGSSAPSADPESGDVSALRKLAQELQIHQVELEMQNQALREAQRELEVSRDRYANLFDFAPVGYATLDERGVILSVNLTLVSLLGTERTRLEEQLFISLVTLESRGLFRHLFEQCTLTMERQETDAVMRSSARGNIYVQLMIEPVKQSEGRERFLVGVVDITEKLLAQRSSQEVQERLNEALEASRVIAWSHDLTTGIVTTSANAARLLGIPESRSYGVHKEMLEDIPKEDRERYEQTMGAAIKAEGSYVAQFRLVSPARDKVQWFEEHGRVVSDGLGRACQIRGVLFDITERKLAEEALLLNFQRLVAFVTDTVDPVALVDGQGLITCISKTGAGLLGYAPGELEGTNALSLAHPDDARLAVTRLAGVRVEPEGSNVMIRLRRKDGAWNWFDLDASPVMRQGNENGYVVKLTAIELFPESQGPG